jgi:hypothetical protein
MMAESQIKKLNKLQKLQQDSSNLYTNTVQNFVSSGMRDSAPLMDSYRKCNLVTKSFKPSDLELRDMALSQLPSFMEVKEVQDLIEQDNLGDEKSELSLETLASFNEDMKVLALNAYQVRDMLRISLEENELLIDWLGHMEYKTTQVQEKVAANLTQIDKTIS